MPKKNGTGLADKGAGPGRGLTGSEMGQGRGRRRMGGSLLRQYYGGQVGLGAGGNCVCLSCSKMVPHQRGMPCTQMKCPQCGAAMTRIRQMPSGRKQNK